MGSNADFTAAKGSTPHPALRLLASPFSGKPDRAYEAWRDWKLSGAPQDVDSLIVEVADIREPRILLINSVWRIRLETSYPLSRTMHS